jgi:hypothetical protein
MAAYFSFRFDVLSKLQYMSSLYQLSPAYNEFYNKGLESFQSKLKDRPNWYVDFYPSLGRALDKGSLDFIFYGQAVNGWDSGFDKATVLDEAKLGKSINASNRSFAEGGHCPVDWVNVRWNKSAYSEVTKTESARSFYPAHSYWCFRSFFWNTTYKTVCDHYGIGRESWEWARKIAWSNLYKIAPENANPSQEEKAWQEEDAKKLIRQEILEIKPKYCIFLTGDIWFKPFSELAQPLQQPQGIPDIIKHIGYIDNSLCVVTHRPMIGNSDSYAKAILEAISKYSSKLKAPF